MQLNCHHNALLVTAGCKLRYTSEEVKKSAKNMIS